MLFKETAEWHLLLCYYALNADEKVEPILQNIVNDSAHTFHDKAKVFEKKQ
jgi:hypothetical protein